MKKLICLMMILILGLCSLGIAACDGGDDDEEATSEATAAATSEETGEATEEATEQPTEDPTEDATSKPTSGGFTWDDMPVYPGAEEDKDALNVAGASEEGRMEWRHYKTTDSFNEVVEFYKSVATAAFICFICSPNTPQ